MVISLKNPLLGFCTKKIDQKKKIQIRRNQTSNNKTGGYYDTLTEHNLFYSDNNPEDA